MNYEEKPSTRLHPIETRARCARTCRRHTSKYYCTLCVYINAWIGAAPRKKNTRWREITGWEKKTENNNCDDRGILYFCVMHAGARRDQRRRFDEVDALPIRRINARARRCERAYTSWLGKACDFFFMGRIRMGVPVVCISRKLINSAEMCVFLGKRIKSMHN